MNNLTTLVKKFAASCRFIKADETIITVNKFQEGDAQSTAKLIGFSFEAMPAESFPPTIQNKGIFNADHTYTFTTSIYTKEHLFVVNLTFDDINKGRNLPLISDELLHKEIRIGDKIQTQTKEQNLSILNTPIGEYLKQHRELDNTNDFLELYNSSNKTFTSTEDEIEANEYFRSLNL